MSANLTLIAGLLACCFFLLAWLARGLLREPWHPAVFFAVNWGVVLLLIIAAAPLGFYAVHPKSSLVFLSGAMLFILGCVVGDRIALATARPSNRSPWDRLNYKKLALLCLLLHVLLLPIWWQEMTRIAGESSDLLVIGFQVRWKTVTGADTIGALTGNYLVLAFIMIPIMVVGVARGKLSIWLALASGLPWVAANLLANGRASLVQLILAILYLRATTAGKFNIRSVLSILLLFAAVFGGGVILVAKGNTDPGDGMGALAFGILTNLSDYLLQGPVLFSRYFNGEVNIVSSWDALGFPCAMLQLLNLCTPGDLHQEFAEFGRLEQYGNVYTIYFAILPKYGPAGLVCILIAYGAWAAFHHRRHKQSQAIAHSLLAAYLFSAIVLSPFADLFAPNLNFLIKAALLASLIQWALSAGQSRQTHFPNSIAQRAP